MNKVPTTEKIREMANKCQPLPWRWTQGAIFTGYGAEMNMIYDSTAACSTWEDDQYTVAACNNAARMASLLDTASVLIEILKERDPKYHGVTAENWLADFAAFQSGEKNG
jgi:hypothetical protein